VEAPTHIAHDEPAAADAAEFALVRQEVGAGCRWTYSAEGDAVARASRVVSIFAAILFVGSAGVLFLADSIGSDNVIRVLSTAWIVAIILALSAAHWRSISGEPLALEVQPEYIELHNPAFLLGRRRRWPLARVRKLVIDGPGKATPGRHAVGSLYLHFRWRSCGLFHGLEIAELQDVADRMHAITGVKVER
jgi:hypothetical protein